MGASYGTAKAGVGVIATGVLRPDLIITSSSTTLIDFPLLNSTPIVMAAVLAIYGVVVSVMIANTMTPETHLFKAFIDLGAGLTVGIASLSAGFAIGITGDSGVRGMSQQPRLFVGMMVIQIFCETLGLYGMIIALLMLSRASSVTCE
ncbi:hypothetical protein Egran_01365 [Elaphomyces granulatus]|uniref:V-type proton ATPase proteolipid subunit n=1 Tax=Elaphomyces granulatus TaxID=519963 RepID=A0A232M381_9EURO|nr:hypothetical protein Egran_01365 [Elaphomyces granulatus]